jgi:hypothetical protein
MLDLARSRYRRIRRLAEALALFLSRNCCFFGVHDSDRISVVAKQQLTGQEFMDAGNFKSFATETSLANLIAESTEMGLQDRRNQSTRNPRLRGAERYAEPVGPF